MLLTSSQFMNRKELNKLKSIRPTLKNIGEYITFTALFGIVSFLVANTFDNITNKIFQRIEKALNMKPDTTLWLVAQIIIQLVLTSISNYWIRVVIAELLLHLSVDDVIYDRKIVSIMFAFINFYGQDNLKKRLTILNDRIDKLFN